MSTTGETVSAPLMRIGHSFQPITDDVLIGKDILELLTGAMYSDPLMVFREYIQNAADAIDDAVQLGYLAESIEGKVEIWFDHSARSIRIRDNGIGVPGSEFTRRLTTIGSSKKRGRQQRGFRGVGRLSGLGYCQQMVLRSRAAEDTKPREIVWDGRRLKELLRDPTFTKPLADAIKEVALIRTLSPEEYPARFFEVELRGVMRLRNDILMNEAVVRAYLSQVGPVGFAPEFALGKEISVFLRKHGLGHGISLVVHDSGPPIFRPHVSSVPVSKITTNTVSELETFEIEGIDGDIAAIGWLLHHDYLGAFPKASAVGGLRLRAGGIQIGGDNILEQVFSEARFNAWSIGEVHILSPKIIPNGRRDDFEANVHWHDLLGKLKPVTMRLSKSCRTHSQARLAMRRGFQLFEQAQKTLGVAKTYAKLQFANDFMLAELEEKLKELKKLQARQVEGSVARGEFDQWVGKLIGPIAALQRSNAKPSVLEFLPSNQRTTFKNALELVLTLSNDPAEASELVERVISHARKAYG